MLNTPFNRQSSESAAWQIRLLTRGEPLRASSLVGFNGADFAVFDTGLPQHTNSLVKALKEYGLTPDDITLVFNTHAHIDHSHNNSLFVGARIFCSRLDREWTHELHETLANLDDPIPADVLAFYPELADGEFDEKIVRKVIALEKLAFDKTRWGNTRQTVWFEDRPALPAGIRVLPTPGHVPHHVSFIIETDAGCPVLLTGDALLERGESHSEMTLFPPHNRAAYQRSQTLINSFAGIVVPGHGEPFDNRPPSPSASIIAAE